MADTKTSDETSAAALDGTELIRIVQSAGNYKLLVSALQTYFATLKTAQNEAPPVTIASSASVAIGAAAANTITISGTNTITAFDTIAAGAWRRVVFSGILTLTHNASSLILPAGTNITTAAGDSAELLSLGSGNWRCVQYTRANGSALVGSSFTGGTLTSALNEAPQVTIASATTTDIGAAGANSVSISGTTTITGLGTIASAAVRRIVFQGVLTLTHNATSLILPGGASITTAAGDVGWFESLGSGNWRCVGYQKASGAAIVGGGGLTNFTEAVSTSTPNATIPITSLTATNAATNVDFAIVPKGTGAIVARIADNGTTNGNKRGANAVDLQRDLNTDAAAVAAGAGSMIGGGFGNKIATACSQSVIAGGYSNSISVGSQSTIGGGRTNSNSSNYGTIAGGFGNSVSTSNYTTVGGGNANSATGTAAVVPGGDSNLASADYSTSIGAYATSRALKGSFALSSNKAISGVGKRQRRSVVLDVSTTDAATTKVLVSNGGAAGTTNQFDLPTGSTLRVSGVVTFRNSTSGDAGSFRIDGQVKNVSGTVSLSGTPVIGTYMGDASLNSVVVAIIADNTNKALQITVNGVAATNIDFVASIDSAETTS